MYMYNTLIVHECTKSLYQINGQGDRQRVPQLQSINSVADANRTLRQIPRSF